MTDRQAKMEAKSLRSTLELDKITARMNQCSSMDCTVLKDMCLSEQVKCRADRKFLGIKVGRKDDMCFRGDMSEDADERKYCDTVCPASMTALQTYLNPYTGESKMLTLYDICLLNVTNSLLAKSACFDLITLNMKTPGMISDQQIKNCFLGIAAKTNTSSIDYNLPTNLNTKTAADATKKADDAKTAATTAGAPASGAGATAPSSGIKEKEKATPDNRDYGSYAGHGEARGAFPTASGAGYGGSYNAGGEGTVTGLTATKIIDPGAENHTKTMIGRHHFITGDKIGTK
jgi:hypothetical protein